MAINGNRFTNWVQDVDAKLRKYPHRAVRIIRTLYRAPAESLEIVDAVTSERHGPEYFVADPAAAESSTDIKWGRWFVG